MYNDNDRLVDDNQVTYYVVRVNGRDVSMRYSNKMMAEQELINLTEAERNVAEVVAITPDGKQVLFG